MNVTQLQKFLGIVMYLAQKSFSICLFTLTHCVSCCGRTLLGMKCTLLLLLKWRCQHVMTWHSATMIPQNPWLFKSILKVRTGHSPAAIGKTSTFTNKALASTEQWYANFEHELLPCVFGAKRLHMYMFGFKLMMKFDHKPLEQTHFKNL